MKHTPEAVADALDWYRSMFEARTYAQGVGFSHDEILVAEIERLQAHHDALVTALEPFAACADFIDSHIREISNDTGLWTPSSSDGSAPSIKASHVRQARATLAKVKPDG